MKVPLPFVAVLLLCPLLLHQYYSGSAIKQTSKVVM